MISAPASSPASSAIPTRSPSSTARCASPMRNGIARISALVAALDELGLRPGDHLVTALQNRWEAATLHWACQFAGIVITPINWRAKADEIDFWIENSEAKAVVFEDVIGRGRRAIGEAAQSRPRIALEHGASRRDPIDHAVERARDRRRAARRRPTPGR